MAQPPRATDAAPDGAQFDFGASSAQSVAHRPADERTAPARYALQRMFSLDEAPVTSLLESVAGGDTLLDGWADKCSLWTPPRYRANCSSTRPPSMTAPACLAILDVSAGSRCSARPSLPLPT